MENGSFKRTIAWAATPSSETVHISPRISQQDVDPWIDSLIKEGELDVNSTEAYYEQYDGAKSDVAQRGGWGLLMPNLSFKPEEKAALVAFLNT